MTDKHLAIMWFRQDLRTQDNPALVEAAKCDSVLPIYILDDENAGEHKMGGASRLWLHHSLKALSKELDNRLQVFEGNPLDRLNDIIKKTGAKSVFWNRCYEPWRIKRDQTIKKVLKENDIEVHSSNGSLLYEPWEVKKSDGSPYRVFTAFYKKGCLALMAPRKPKNRPSQLTLHQETVSKLSIEDLNLTPSIPWDKPINDAWEVGEHAAKKRLKAFLKSDIDQYKKGRDFPALNAVSRLSPHIHFGEISPNQIWHAVKALKQTENTEHFCQELGWREFSYHLLYHNPELPKKNLQEKFNSFPWLKSKKNLEAWQKGQTGIPIVDAGMRELWLTGYMHNRVRMIVGSFLVKNLGLHWHHGEAWFWDCLVDADLANNSASWQWVAGTGADAAPYFRIFNPVTQGEKFDADGEYTRKFVPELRDLPNKYLFKPWEAPLDVLKKANIRLGETYPQPLVDLKESRERALVAFKGLKS